jgi:trigger factor
MNRKKLFALLGLTVVLTVTGCGKKETDTAPAATEAAAQTETTAAADEEAADPETDEQEESTDAEAADTLDPITPSDYLIANISDYVTPGELTGLEVTQYNYEITDDMIQEQIDSELSYAAEENEVDRASESGDIVYVELTSSISGEEDSESMESTYFQLGDEEYGADFDQQLTGVTAGETKTFSITFGDDIWVDEWMDQTVDFTIEVTSVCEQVVPEYNDDFVSEYTDYSTTAEYEAALRDSLTEELEESSQYDAIESLFDSAVEASVFAGYPQELYDSSKAELLEFYSIFTGTTDEEDVYELFDITAEDLDEEVLATVNRRLLISAICEENGLEITEEEYVQYVTEYAESYGYDSAADFEADNSREALVWSLFEAKAGDYLYENANITEEAADMDDYDIDDELELDEDDVYFETETE